MKAKEKNSSPAEISFKMPKKKNISHSLPKLAVKTFPSVVCWEEGGSENGGKTSFNY